MKCDKRSLRHDCKNTTGFSWTPLNFSCKAKGKMRERILLCFTILFWFSKCDTKFCLLKKPKRRVSHAEHKYYRNLCRLQCRLSMLLLRPQRFCLKIVFVLLIFLTVISLRFRRRREWRYTV